MTKKMPEIPFLDLLPEPTEDSESSDSEEESFRKHISPKNKTSLEYFDHLKDNKLKIYLENNISQSQNVFFKQLNKITTN